MEVSIRFTTGHYLRFIREDNDKVAIQLFDEKDNHIATERETCDAFMRGIALVAGG